MLSLQICITPAAIAAIKFDLAKALPAVKASHRVEALARSLGFRTYASMRAASKAPSPHASVNGGAFVQYLREHGFETSGVPLYKAAARVALGSVLEKEPLLCLNGIGAGGFDLKPDGTRETAQQRRARFMRSRSGFFSDFAVGGFLRAISFLSRVRHTKTIRPRPSSYGLKHIAEKYPCTYPEGEPLGPHYVSNGALIAAAIHLGFSYKKYTDHLGWRLCNVTFNMSRRDILALNQENQYLSSLDLMAA
jgi:hypothetical protein